MRIVLAFYLLLLSHPTWAQNQGTIGQDINDIINDPSVSLRCKEMIKERNDKVATKQKLKSLFKRNEKLVNKVPKNKKTTRVRLDLSLNQIKNEIYLINMQIAEREENIVRQGCPGIRL
jgi:hypothetical protein